MISKLISLIILLWIFRGFPNNGISILFRFLKFQTQRIYRKVVYIWRIGDRITIVEILKISISILRDKIYRLCGGDISNIELKDNKYILTYRYGLRIYKIMWRGSRGPDKILRINNENGEDVTKYVRTFMGPGENFHDTYMSPADLGFNSLNFFDFYGGVKIFNNKQVIILD